MPAHPHDLLFHVLFLGAMAVVGLVRLRYSRRIMLDQDSASRRSLSFVLRQLAAIGAFLVIAAHTIKPSLMSWTEFSLPLLVRLIAVPMVIVTIVIVSWVADEVAPGINARGSETLVTSGVYGLVRHPLYAAVTAAAVALTLLSANWVVGLLSVALCVDLLAVRARREDARLALLQPEAYAAYAARTPAFIPRWRKSQAGAVA